LADAERRGTSSDVDGSDDGVLAQALMNSLRAVQAGDRGATDYHNLMIGVTEFIFFPHLTHPKKEREIHQGRKRIDILFENAATAGIFERMARIRHLPCGYVPFECKNYTTDVANPELDQLAGRFAVNRGQFGFLCCRTFEDRQLFIERCRDTFNDGRGLIIPLDDDTVIRLLTMIQEGRRHELDEVLSNLVAEVSVG
jgi:hypothetical protein